MDRGAGRATVHGVTKSWTELSNQKQQMVPDHLFETPILTEILLCLSISYLLLF